MKVSCFLTPRSVVPKRVDPKVNRSFLWNDAAAILRRDEVARLRHVGFRVWVRISTDSRKAAPCRNWLRPTVSPSFLRTHSMFSLVGAKNFTPSYLFRPFILSCQRHESFGRTQIAPKNINLGEVAHLPPCIAATRWQGCAIPDSVFWYASLQIVARLRHAGIG